MKDKMYGYIYITTCRINGKKYIGQKIFDKKGVWRTYLGSGVMFSKALKKYGKENFYSQVIAIGYNKNDLNILEYNTIKQHDATKSLDYYNIAEGGHMGSTSPGMHHTEETKQKIRASKIGRNIGEQNSFYGKRHTEETKRIIKEKNTGINSSQATKVICITTNEVFYTLTDACNYYNIPLPNISDCCRNKRKSAGKHPKTKEKLIWAYA